MHFKYRRFPPGLLLNQSYLIINYYHYYYYCLVHGKTVSECISVQVERAIKNGIYYNFCDLKVSEF